MTVVSEDLRRAARSAYERADHGKLKKACRQILEQDPQDAEARRLLGLAALKDDRPDLAEGWFREAAARQPDSATAWRNLARALVQQRREQEAEAILSAAAARGVSTAGAMTMLGAIRIRLDRSEDARAAFDAAVEMDPTRGEAYGGLVEVGGLGVDSAAYAQARRLLDTNRFTPASAVAAGLAVAEAERRAGRLADFMQRLHEAKAAERELPPRRTLTAKEAWIAALREASAEARAAKRAQAPDTAVGPIPIFLIGEPCCGAELAEAMLAAEPGVFAAGEINLIQGAVAREIARASRIGSAVSVAALGEEERAWARGVYLGRARRIAPEARWFVDRSPGLAHQAGALRVLFPEARIIRLERSALRQGLDIYRTWRPLSDPRLGDLRSIGRDLRIARRTAAKITKRSDLGITAIDMDALIASPIEEGPTLRSAAGLPMQLHSFSSPRIRRAFAALTAISDPDLDALADTLAPLRRSLGEFGRD